MPLADLVSASAAIAATPSRREKIALAANLLKVANTPDARLAVAYLAGHIPQGRLNIARRAWSPP